MKYPVVLHHDNDSAYGVSVPDLPGCFSAGDTFDEALQNVAEAIELHLEGLEDVGGDIPRASKIEEHLGDKDYAGGTWGFVDIDVTPYLGKTEKINVSLPFSVIRRIDEQTGARGRSRFLAEAALKALES